jgi:bromodomain and PHD finger-containing protein 3
MEIQILTLSFRTQTQCLLCPLLGADLRTEDGHRAHRLCADFVPETRVVSGPSGDMVVGIDDVPSARWKLVSHCGKCKLVLHMWMRY